MADIAPSFIQTNDLRVIVVKSEDGKPASTKLQRQRQPDVAHPYHANLRTLRIYSRAERFGSGFVFARFPGAASFLGIL